MATAARRAETSSFARERNHSIQPTAVAVDTQESVREDSAIEERTELTLDEARHDPFLDTRMCQPSLEVVLAIVVSGSRWGQDATRIEFPRHNASMCSRPERRPGTI
jgi:hypothetical protein